MISAPVNCIAISNVHSAATMILSSGTGKRIAFNKLNIGIHIALKAFEKDRRSKAPKKLVGQIETSAYLNFRNELEGFWRKNASLPKIMYPMHSEISYYLTPKQALEFAMIDIICEPHQLEEFLTLSHIKANP